ncbi:hypothetical protein F5X96DRAFT_436504 [Biscogniauxia mediterranea]|nr:hypothetical protein F5X96DRAFT_436504 [Biscogniauxia mediterranea]
MVTIPRPKIRSYQCIEHKNPSVRFQANVGSLGFCSLVCFNLWTPITKTPVRQTAEAHSGDLHNMDNHWRAKLKVAQKVVSIYGFVPSAPEATLQQDVPRLFKAYNKSLEKFTHRHYPSAFIRALVLIIPQCLLTSISTEGLQAILHPNFNSTVLDHETVEGTMSARLGRCGRNITTEISTILSISRIFCKNRSIIPIRLFIGSGRDFLDCDQNIQAHIQIPHFIQDGAKVWWR